jgi:hypothetical protein
MSFTPSDPHLTVALVLTGSFGQFADPLDWIAKQYGLDVKVDRMKLAESLASPGGGVQKAMRAKANALGSDKKTRFAIELFGRCEGKLVALCSFSFDPERLPMTKIEEDSTGMVVLNPQHVLGVQATPGGQEDSLEGLTAEKAVLRLLPLNVFNRSFFRPKIEMLEGDKKLKILDAGLVAVVELVKPWLFYDVPPRRNKKPIALLPF